MIAESRSNSISCTPIVSQKELQRLTCLNRSSSPLSRFTRKPEQSPVSDSVHRYRFTRNTGSGESQTAPSSPETHKEEEPTESEVAEPVTASAEAGDATVQAQSQIQQPSHPIPVKTNPVLVHVADYVSSDCVDSVDDSDDQVSLARVSAVLPADDDDDDAQSFPESSEEELPVEIELEVTPVVSASVTASKSDGQIYRRRCEQFDVSTSSLNQQTQCCMRFKTHPKSSRVKSQSHSCHLV